MSKFEENSGLNNFDDIKYVGEVREYVGSVDH